MKRLLVVIAVAILARPLSAQTVTRIVADPERVEVTAGESVATPRTKPWGCSVKY